MKRMYRAWVDAARLGVPTVVIARWWGAPVGDVEAVLRARWIYRQNSAARAAGRGEA